MRLVLPCCAIMIACSPVPDAATTVPPQSAATAAPAPSVSPKMAPSEKAAPSPRASTATSDSDRVMLADSGPIPAAPAPKAATVTPPDGSFTVDSVTAFLVNSRNHVIEAAKGTDLDDPGVRLWMFGSLRNNTKDLVFRGGLFGSLEACFGGNCVSRESEDRGFNLALSGTEPWLPSEARSFNIVTRAFDPVYSLLTPETVTYQLTVDLRGALGGRWEGVLVAGARPWQEAQGYATTEKPSSGSTAGVSGPYTLTLGPTGGATWAVRTALAPIAPLPATWNPLPFVATGESLSIAVTRAAPFRVRHETDGKPDETLLALDVTVKQVGEKPSSCSFGAEVAFGPQKSLRPMARPPEGAGALTCTKLELGESATGKLFFAWPTSFRPVAIVVTPPKSTPQWFVFSELRPF